MSRKWKKPMQGQVIDLEAAAITDMDVILSPLTQEQRERILAYACQRWTPDLLLLISREDAVKAYDAVAKEEMTDATRLIARRVFKPAKEVEQEYGLPPGSLNIPDPIRAMVNVEQEMRDLIADAERVMCDPTERFPPGILHEVLDDPIQAMVEQGIRVAGEPNAATGE